MTQEFKPVRFFVLIGLVAFFMCSVAVFCTQRAGHGTTAEERAAYESGEKAGKEATRDATLPTEAELNMMAQKCLEQQGPGQQLRNPSRAGGLQACKQAFEKGTRTGSRKRILRSEPAAFTGSENVSWILLLDRSYPNHPRCALFHAHQ